MTCNFDNYNNFVTLASKRLRFPEDDSDALEHAGVLTVYKILFIHIRRKFVGLDNKMNMCIAYPYTVDNIIDCYSIIALK